MRTRLAERIAERERVLTSFLEVEKGRIALCCHAMARAFARGGTLIAFGTRAAATDAAHVAVEFMHPVIVGKRALPALAPTNDPTRAATVLRLARGDDIALGIAHGSGDGAVDQFLAEARDRGLLTIAFWGSGEPPDADFAFVVRSDDAQIVQEVQETAYHVLWELVHVFFEHPGLLDDSRSGTGKAGTSDLRPLQRRPSRRLRSLAGSVEPTPAGRLGRVYGAACITCGDVAVEARVVAVRNGTAVIEKDGLREEVAVELVDGVGVGDVLLCHAGVALEKLA